MIFKSQMRGLKAALFCFLVLNDLRCYLRKNLDNFDGRQTSLIFIFVETVEFSLCALYKFM